MDNFHYLGNVIVTNGKIQEDITEVIKNAGKLYQLVRDIIWNCEMPKTGKIYLKTNYMTIVKHVAQTWRWKCRSIEGKTKRE